MIALALAALAAAAAAPDLKIDAALKAALRTAEAPAYQQGRADLNGDGRPEVFALKQGPSYCGSGGCTLIVLSPGASGGYTTVLQATLARAPVRVLSSRSRGWRDIAVPVSGGGAKPFEARLRFNGRRYPSNPSLQPQTPAGAAGETVITGG